MNKLQELAEKYSKEATEIHNSNPEDSYRDFIAGFKKAREMAYELCWDYCGAQCELDLNKILKLGE